MAVLHLIGWAVDYGALLLVFLIVPVLIAAAERR